MATTHYSVCLGVYFVEIDKQGIVMDVVRDRFFALSSKATAILRSVEQPSSCDLWVDRSAAASESSEARDLAELVRNSSGGLRPAEQ
jgi:hypothetical protein